MKGTTTYWQTPPSVHGALTHQHAAHSFNTDEEHPSLISFFYSIDFVTLDPSSFIQRGGGNKVRPVCSRHMLHVLMVTYHLCGDININTFYCITYILN